MMMLGISQDAGTSVTEERQLGWVSGGYLYGPGCIIILFYWLSRRNLILGHYIG